MDPTEPNPSVRPSGRTKLAIAAGGFALAGLASGLAISAMGAGAATSPTGAVTAAAASGSGSTTAPPSGSGSSTGPGTMAGGCALPDSGTVTAVGATSVTIQTSTATTTYAVTSQSDIDKNGESQLSALAVGDKVTFSTTSSSTPTIDRLHAGNAAQDRPAGTPPAGAPQPSTGSGSSA